MAKFKVGERARIIAEKDPYGVVGRQCTIVDLCPLSPESDYSVVVDGFDPRRFGATMTTCGIKEKYLRKLLPDSDSYRPATQSLDDILRSVRQRETV